MERDLDFLLQVPTTYAIVFKTLGVFLLVLLNGFFTAAELAIVKIRGTQIETLLKKKHHRAHQLEKVIKHLGTYLSATQLGVTLSSLGLGWLGEPFVAQLLFPLANRVGIQSVAAVNSLAFGVAFALITFFHIILGELAPKSVAIQRTEQIALGVAIPLILFYKIFFPAIWLLNKTANALLSFFGLQLTTHMEPLHSDEELRILLGKMEEEEESLARGIQIHALALKSLRARNIMLPRNKIVPLYVEISFEENLKIAQESRHTRFPLCRDDLDHIVGMVHIKDLLWQVRQQDVSPSLDSIRRDILFFTQFVSLETLLKAFLEKKCHMAIIVDEFGGTLGMVTLEDVLEELVGEIQDEFDQEQPLIQRVDDHNYLADGSTPLHDLQEELGVQLPDIQDATTVGGYVTHRYGEIPPVGSRWTYGNLKFSVEKADQFRVLQVRIKKLPAKTLEPSPSAKPPA